jgi:esterase/lipase/1-acyl-sn-glycerol-3-phosphate acyltransferase
MSRLARTPSVAPYDFMPSLAFRLTKYTLNLARKLIKADVRVHNAEHITDGMAIVFVVNHFTRLETFLLPYEIHRITGKEAWSLAAGNLFVGGIGRYLKSVGTVSTHDPDRDKLIIRSLLEGDRPWIIFPEGMMVKDKKLVDAAGMFEVYGREGRRPPHSGAAALALRAEYYREKLRCLADRPGGDEDMKRGLAHFELTSFDRVRAHRTVIIPINVTYFPIRARENIFLRAAGAFAKDLSQRAIEELSVEGTMLSSDCDIDITLAAPIEVREYLEEPEFAELMACGLEDLPALESNPKSAFNEAARNLMLRYMAEIYGQTTINYDHILATIVRHQRVKRLSERAYRNRIFLAVRELIESGKYRLHELLRKRYRDVLYEDPSPRFEDYMRLALEEGVLRKVDGLFEKHFSLERGKSDFHDVRRREMTYVIANEIEPLADVIEIVRRVARMTRREASARIREIILTEDLQIFARDHFASVERGPTKPQEIGRPFLLKPERIRAGIVLVHGYLSAPMQMRAMAERFVRAGYAVYAVRLKGHGTSPEDLATTTWEEWYESLNRGYAAIKSLTDRIIVGGFSTGGALALLAAARKGEKIEAAFAINAPLRLRDYKAKFAPQVAAINSFVGRMRGGAGPLEYVANDAEDAGMNYDQNPVAGVRELGEVMEVLERSLGDVRAPTLIVQGSRDPVVEPASGQLIFGRLGTSDKELVVLERDRHGILNGEGAIDVCSRVEHFLDWVESRSAARDNGAPVRRAPEPDAERVA